MAKDPQYSATNVKLMSKAKQNEPFYELFLARMTKTLSSICKKIENVCFAGV